MLAGMRIIAFIIVLLLATPALAGFEAQKLVDAAKGQVGKTLTYDPAYVSLKYPGGDVPVEKGVCSDVVIRAYRAVGFDLQQLVHDDMKKHFGLYPKTWGLKKTDTNIDHRRVPNLQVFFTRKGQSLGVSENPADYKPGDIVTWNLRGPRDPLPHIGIVTDEKSADGKRPLMAHNIGRGAQVEDMLFDYTVTGHYRYTP
jgi:uncharacterized protein YijF (DUF1287 family)